MRRPAEGMEERIRQRAYYLWEASGRPQGRDHEFWAQARELIAAEDRAILPVPPPSQHAGGGAPWHWRTSGLWARLRRTWHGD